MTIRRRMLVVLLTFSALTVLVLLWAPTVGSTSISLRRAFDSSLPSAENVDAQILFVARLPRVLAGALVGAALATSGVVLQALLRNPLATPFTLGVSAGGALGAILAITFELDLGALGVSSVPIASFVGSLVAIAIVHWLATIQQRGLSTNVLLLAGVTLNSFFSALILFVQYLGDYAESFRTIRWLMGDLDVGSYGAIVASLPFVAVAFVVFAVLPRTLNLLTMGEEVAAARGVEVVRAQRWAFLSASLATGAAVSLGGPVGFIGIVVPHLVRLMVGSDHRVVLPASALFGAAFLVMCDVGARTVMAPVELPVGIVTALIGGPFFLWLLVKKS
jgi:iron complex transport system permease protein